MSIKTIIVDDVKLARERIRILLDDEEIKIIAECKNGREAIKTIRTLEPDLVFLDIQMPKINGFDVVEAIGVEQMPAVIFITAHDQFALRAFEVNAIDYLLKPFDETRLMKAVLRAKREIRNQESSVITAEKLRKLLKEVNEETQYLKRIPVKSTRGMKFVLIEEIDWIASDGRYLELHTGNKTHLIREKLSEMETKLDPQVFMRIHRSTIVNLNRIELVHPLFNGDQLIILKNGSELNLSRTYYEKLISRLTR